MKIAEKVLMDYLQNWGQPFQKRIDALNIAIESARIKAKFRYDSLKDDLYSVGFTTGDSSDAIAFKDAIDNIDRGKFEDEVKSIEALIAEYARRKQQ